MNKHELQKIIDTLVKNGYHVKRTDMPQIRSDLVPDFIDYLNILDIDSNKKMLAVNKLKSTQGEIDIEKVLPLMDVDKLEQMNKPIIVSSDLYILDGHHRFTAMYALDDTMKMNCIIVDTNIKDLLEKAKQFSGVSYKNLTEQYGLMSFEQFLNEKLITFGGIAYPKFGQIVILAGGAGCFDGATLVNTQKGYKKISNININDEVWTFNLETKHRELNKVNDIVFYSEHPEKIIKFTFKNEEIICTENHEFYIDNEWIKAININVKKEVVNPRKVYDLRIENNHNYEITKSNITVHNSGKGFISSKLMGIEGKVLDVDALKQLALESPMIIAKAKKIGVDLEALNLKNPDDVSMLHTVLADRLGITDKHKELLFQSVMTSSPERKPNLIFDVTLKDTKKFREITDYSKMLGYSPENIHMVWVINDIEIAQSQNRGRDRVVPEDILTLTHVGAAQTVKDLLDSSVDLQSKLDGDIIFAFNKAYQHTEWEKTDKEGISQKVNPDSTILKSSNGGSYIKEANYIYVKKKGQPVMKSKDLGSLILKKIFDYTPSQETWGDLFDS